MAANQAAATQVRRTEPQVARLILPRPGGAGTVPSPIFRCLSADKVHRYLIGRGAALLSADPPILDVRTPSTFGFPAAVGGCGVFGDDERDRRVLFARSAVDEPWWVPWSGATPYERDH